MLKTIELLGSVVGKMAVGHWGQTWEGLYPPLALIEVLPASWSTVT